MSATLADFTRTVLAHDAAPLLFARASHQRAQEMMRLALETLAIGALASESGRAEIDMGGGLVLTVTTNKAKGAEAGAELLRLYGIPEDA